jgi:hypothetical protein
VRDPRAHGNLARDLGDRAVGHAQKDEVGVADVEIPSYRSGGNLLAETGGDGLADATRADDAR